MKTLLTAALLVASFAVQAETITLGTQVGQGGGRTYYNVPNDSGFKIDIEINAMQNHGKVTIGSVSCSGYMTQPFKCNDGRMAGISLFESHPTNCHAGICNSHWQLNGGTIER